MLTARPESSQSSRRDAWVEINLSNLESNIATVHSWLQHASASNSPARLMGVIKSDAYGHGALAVGEVLAASGAAWLAVASVDEGCQLRSGGIKLPILVLSPTPSWAISTALKNNLDLTVTSFHQLNELVDQVRKQEKPTGVHLKIDTGMHRLGFAKKAIPELIDQLNLFPQMKLVSIFSHLAKADDLECTRAQNEAFEDVLAMFAKAGRTPEFVHIASSEASRRFPFAHHDMVRVGINLFGLEACEISQDLVPVLALRGRINQISTIGKGESVGYGLTWTAERETKLAVIPIGYGDGVDRRLSNRMRGLLSGRVVPQVGRISMDQMIFDVTDVAHAEEGDVITLIGSELGSDRGQGRTRSGSGNTTITLAEWAQSLGTITYELACRLRIRLPRIYTRSSSTVLPGALKSNSGRK
jgi:alanine racemase